LNKNNANRESIEAEEDDTTQLRLPAGRLFRSYIIITMTYIGFFTLMIPSMFLISYVFYFPAYENWKEQLSDNTDAFMWEIATSRFWAISLFLVTAALGFFSGQVVARLAPFGRFGHGVLLAVLFFVTILQSILSDEQLVPNWIMVVELGVVPVATLFGAKACSLKMLEADSATEQPAAK